MAKFKFIKLLFLFLILSAVVLFSAMNIPLTQNSSIKIFYISLLVPSLIFIFYIIYKMYRSLAEDIFISPMKEAIAKHEELKKTNPEAKFPLNGKQISIIILSGIGLVLAFFWGIYLPLYHPINILLYFILGLIVIILGLIIIKPTYCPKCGTKLPIIRKPLDENEKLYGWTTCPKCGTQVDTHGNAVKK